MHVSGKISQLGGIMLLLYPHLLSGKVKKTWLNISQMLRDYGMTKYVNNQ